jgi:hypothetical protein
MLHVHKHDANRQHEKQEPGQDCGRMAVIAALDFPNVELRENEFATAGD